VNTSSKLVDHHETLPSGRPPRHHGQRHVRVLKAQQLLHLLALSVNSGASAVQLEDRASPG